MAVAAVVAVSITAMAPAGSTGKITGLGAVTLVAAVVLKVPQDWVVAVIWEP